MADSIERANEVSAGAEKRPWTVPVLQAIEMKAALGAAVGTKCDRYGSVSHGSGCP
jgi:hypothetical protein